MSQQQQPEALRVAAWLITAPQSTTHGDMLIAGRELRRLHARVLELEAWQEEVRSNSPLLARLEKAESAVSGLQKRKDDWEWRAMEAEAQLEAKQAALLGYDSGLQAGNRVTLCFDSQANATRWLEGFCNSYDAAHGTKSIALPIPLPTAQTAQTQEQKKRD